MALLYWSAAGGTNGSLTFGVPTSGSLTVASITMSADATPIAGSMFLSVSSGLSPLRLYMTVSTSGDSNAGRLSLLRAGNLLARVAFGNINGTDWMPLTVGTSIGYGYVEVFTSDGPIMAGDELQLSTFIFGGARTLSLGESTYVDGPHWTVAPPPRALPLILRPPMHILAR